MEKDLLCNLWMRSYIRHVRIPVAHTHGTENIWYNKRFISYAHDICASPPYLCVIIKEVININTYNHEHKAYESFGVYRGDC